MITLEEAKRNQEKLHGDATRLLQELRLQELLRKYGELIVEGSYAYGLMHKPDIDLRVINDKPDKSAIAELTGLLYRIDNVLTILTMDMYRLKPKDPPKPKGYYIGLKVSFNELQWNIDIWVVHEANAGYTPYASPEEIKKFSDQDKGKILLLKTQLDEAGQDYNSSRVYRAVVEDKVSTVQEFEAWRTQHPAPS
jgi:hypothetical protein